MATNTLTTYSNVGGTTSCSAFMQGATVYANGYLTESVATIGTTVVLELYNDAGVKQGSSLIDTPYSFAENTAVLLSTVYGTMPSCTAPNTLGSYYLKLSISGTGVETYYLYVRFQVILYVASTTEVYTTTADFNTGVHDGTMADGDNLYSGLYENFADLGLAEQFTTKTQTAPFVYSSGYAYQPSGGATYGILEPTTSFALTNLRNVITKTKYNQYCLAITDKATIPVLGSYGTFIIYVNKAGSGKAFIARYVSDVVDGVSVAWYYSFTNGVWQSGAASASDVMSTDVGKVKLEANGTQWRLLFYDGDDVYKGATTWVDFSGTFSDTGILWSWCGKVSGDTYAQEIYSFTLKLATSIWVSSDITPPTSEKLKDIAFTLSNGIENENYINKIEVYSVSGDTLLDTANKNVHATGSYSASDFTDWLQATIDTPYYFKVYFVSGVTSLFTVADITLTYETLAKVRVDGQLWRV